MTTESTSALFVGEDNSVQLSGGYGTISTSTDKTVATEEGKAQDTDPENGFSFRKQSSRAKYTLAMCAMANICSGIGFSLMAPFFPLEAEKKGVSTTVTGLIFSLFELVVFLTSPIFGTYLTKIGPKFMYISGIGIGGTCAILFGFLDRCPPGATFVAICMVCRGVEAVGISAFITASFAIISSEFPKNVSTVFGALETATGIGLMIGPAIGGVLFDLGGFGLPFYVLGSIILLNGVLIYKFLPEPEKVERKTKGSVFSLLRSPLVIVTSLSIMTGGISIAFQDPTLTKHLSKFGLSSSVVGLFFIIGPGLYGITAPLWGYIVDSKDIQAPLMIVGNMMCALGFIFLGPSPLLPFIPFELWSIIVGLFIWGFFIGCTVVPTMKCLVMGAQELGFEENIDTYGFVSGYFNSLFSVGCFIGPSLGGVMVDELGFAWASTILTGVFLLIMVIMIVFFTYRRIRSAPGPEHASQQNQLARSSSRRRSSFRVSNSH